MDTIIARQDIARRRRPYAPIAPSARTSPSFFDIPGKRENWKAPGSGRFQGAKAKEGLSSIYSQQKVHRHKSRGSGSASPLAGLASSLSGLAHAASAFFANLPGKAKAGTVIFEIIPDFRIVREEEPAQARRKAGTRELPRWLFLSGASILVLGLAALLFLAMANRNPRVSPEGLLPVIETRDDPAADILLAYLSPELAADPDEDSIKAVPIPKSLEISTYTVKPGDSIGAIANRFGRSVDSILSLNGIKNVKSLKSGTILKIPNMNGVLHIVKKGESLGKLAKDNKVDVTSIADANDLGSSTLTVGMSIFIPGAKLSSGELQRIYGTTITWPARGPISSYFGIRSDPFTGVRRFHAGVDIVVGLGTAVKAAMDGKIVDLGYNANYGNYIIMNNSDGMQTLYGHLSAFCVGSGQSVKAGTVIAKSGNTGYSTGPHLHFSIYKQGAATNPLKLLK